MKLPDQYRTAPSFTASKSTFVSRGTTCAATLRTPGAHSGPVPAILMVHGWGGVQESFTPPFYEEFCRAGFAVMTFDYPGWGESEGQPRNGINPKHRVRDANAALTHLKSFPNIDADKIVLWGSSFGGGHVAEIAADHPELLGAIAKVPMLDGMLAVRAVPLARLLRFFLYAIADILKPGPPIYLPVVSKPGEFGSMDRDDAFKAMKLGLEAIKIDYDNRVTARSLLSMGPYRPGKRLKDIRVPFLIIGGTRDTVAPFNEDTIRRLKNPYIQVQTIEANHFEPYFEPAFSASIALQLAFLRSLQVSSLRNASFCPTSRYSRRFEEQLKSS
jgi:uncharacterized protein